MSLSMPRPMPAFQPDVDAFAAVPCDYSSSFSLFADEREFSHDHATFFSSPALPPAAHPPRPQSSSLFRLSPTFHESYQFHWADASYSSPKPVGASANTSAIASTVPSPSPPPPPAFIAAMASAKIEASSDAHSLFPAPPSPIPRPSSVAASVASSVAFSTTPSSSPPSTPEADARSLSSGALSAARTRLGRRLSPSVDERGSTDKQMRKRRRQRECDLQRRQKEGSGYGRLCELLASSAAKKQQRQIKQQHKRTEEEEEEEEDAEDVERKLNKADILHQSAERIEQLERALHQMTERCSRRTSLEASMLVHSTVCIALIHVPSGCVVDVSERYLQQTGNERAWLLNRRFFPPLHLLQTNPKYLTRPYPSHSYQASRVLCKPGSGVLQETRQCPQAEASLRQMRALYAGEVDSMLAVWRSQFGDGRVMDKAVHSWVTDWEQHTDGTRTPLYVTGLVNTSEVYCVE